MVAIITLNYNQNDFTLKCVESVLKSNYQNFKLFLIENGSTESNYKDLKEKIPKNDLLEVCRLEKNRGYVGGINYGLAEANKIDPDYFLIMNNDTIIDSKSVSELVKTCIDFENNAIVTGKVYHYDEPDVLQDIGLSYISKNALQFDRIGMDEKDIGQYDKLSERDLLDDVFWIFSSKLYKEIGGYSPYFWFNAEQADFALRAKRKGYKLVYTPLAKLWHKGSISIGGRDRNPKLAYWHVQSTLIFRFLHLNKFQFIFQYIKMIKNISFTYAKTFLGKIKGGKLDYNYPNAKLKGLSYFNKWFFIRNENNGENPFS